MRETTVSSSKTIKISLGMLITLLCLGCATEPVDRTRIQHVTGHKLLTLSIWKVDDKEYLVNYHGGIVRLDKE